MVRNPTLRLVAAGVLIGTGSALLSPTATGQGPVPPPPGVVGWWALDNSTADSGTLSLDAKLAGAGGAYEPAQVREGFRPASPDGHVSVPDHDVLDFRTNFTVECWVRVDALGTGHSYIVNKGSGDHRSTPFTFGLIRASNTFTATSGSSMTGLPWGGRPFVTLSDGILEQVVFGGSSVPLGAFTHLAFTVEWMNPGHQCRLYINGTQSSYAWLSRLPFSNTTPLQIGGIPGSGGNSLNGVIDEVTVYDKSLTATQIRSIFLAGVEGKKKPNNDTTPPDVTIDSPRPGQVLGNPMVTLQATVIDESSTSVSSIPAGLSDRVPAGGGIATGTVSLPGPDGNQVITVQAIDDNGNAAATSVDIVLDTSPPIISVISPRPGTAFGTSPIQFAVQVDDLTATQLTIGGVTRPLPPGLTAVTLDVPLLPGRNGIRLSAVDEAGNRTELSWDLVLDTSAPVVEILDPPDGALFGAYQGPVAVTVRVDDLTETSVTSLPAGIAGSLPNGGGVLSGTVSLDEGLNQIVVTVTDSAGTTASAAVSVNLDSTPPVVNIISPSYGELLRGTIEVTVSAEDVAPGSGVGQIELYVGKTLVASAAGANLLLDLDTTGLADGEHFLTAVGTDGAGNQDAISLPFTVDNTPPTIQILSPSTGTILSGEGQFSALASDPLSGVISVIQKVGGLAPTVDDSVELSFPTASVQVDSMEDTLRWPDGALTCEVQATDLAGNTSTAQVQVEVQNYQAAPHAPSLKPRDGARVHGKIKINLKGPDGASFVTPVDCHTHARGWHTPLKVHYDSTQQLDRVLEIRGIVRDGSQTLETVHHVIVDNIRVKGFHPSHLNLSSRKQKGYVWIKIENRNGYLALRPDTKIELRMRGGTPVQALSIEMHKRSRKAWVQFDRASLVAAIRGALAAGNYEKKKTKKVELGCYIDGHEVDQVKVKVRHGRWWR